MSDDIINENAGDSVPENSEEVKEPQAAASDTPETAEEVKPAESVPAASPEPASTDATPAAEVTAAAEPVTDKPETKPATTPETKSAATPETKPSSGTRSAAPSARPKGRGDYRGRERQGQQGGPRNPRFRRKVCRFCYEKDLAIDYKRPDILERFITDRGKILPRRVTGTCSKHQRALARAIKRARLIAFLPFVEK